MYFICVLLYRKRPVATSVNRFPVVLLYFPNCETGNRKNPKSGQPQPAVRLHSVASGPVSVFFSVHATGLADTTYLELDTHLYAYQTPRCPVLPCPCIHPSPVPILVYSSLFMAVRCGWVLWWRLYMQSICNHQC